MNIPSRIRQTRESQRLSEEEFARKLGVSRQVYQSVEAGTASISVEKLMELSRLFRVNSHWLIYGMDASSDYPYLAEGSSYMPLVDEKAVAGYLENDSDPEYLRTLDFYKIPGFQEGEHCIFRVHGDSMLPTIQETDQLICSKCKSVDELSDNEIIVVVTGKEVVVKRVGFLDGEKEHLLLKSDNPDYRVYSLPLKEVKEIWVVKAKITQSLDISSNTEGRIEMMERELQELRKTFHDFSRKFSGEDGQE